MKLDNCIIFDLETTGLSPNTESIIEIAGLKIIDGKIVDTFESFIAFDGKLSYIIKKITGITDAHLASAPFEKDVISDFYKFADNFPLVAHNGKRFDSKFLNKSYNTHLNIDVPNEIIDSLDIFKAKLPGLKSYKLDLIKDYFEIEITQTHRALDDCHLLWSCLQKLDTTIKS